MLTDETPEDVPDAEIRLQVFENKPSGGFGLQMLNAGESKLSLKRTIDVLVCALGLANAQEGNDYVDSAMLQGGYEATTALMLAVENSQGLPVPTPREFARRIEVGLEQQGYVIARVKKEA